MVIKIIKYRVASICWVSLMLLVFSCRKLAEVEAPFTSVNAGTVYTDDARAISVLTGLYIRMSGGSAFTGTGSISLYSGLSADELTLYSGVTDTRLMAYYQNALSANSISSLGSEFWSPIYNYIFTCNSAIEGLNASSVLTSSVKEQLLGEAKFMRAYLNFYLVNLFGDIPIVVTTDYKVNAQLVRSSQEQVYKQIIEDLNDAKSRLSGEYLNGSLQKYSNSGVADRIRPTKWAATTLLARAYLYSKDWINAEAQATSVINNLSLFDTVNVANVFLKNNKEAIWQLQPVNSGRNTEDAQLFILTASGPTSSSTRPCYLSAQLLNVFENGDKRKLKWVDSIVTTGTGIKYFFPSKYKNLSGTVTEFLTLLRLGEVYLIRAEARAQQGNINGAKDDLDVIRLRAGLLKTTANDKVAILEAVQKERAVELFSELGHRWFDLKRTNKVDEVMKIITPVKSNGSPWQSYQQLYPLPFKELQSAPNLIQNDGFGL